MKRKNEKADRLIAANLLLETIGSTGRGFLNYTGDGGVQSHMIETDRGHIRFVDGYSKKAIWPYKNGAWRGFSSGGTMRGIVTHLLYYIQRGTPLPEGILGPWPEWYAQGDPWGYGAEDMEKVRNHAVELGIYNHDEKD